MHNFSNGDTLTRRDDSLILTFANTRRILSTSPHNGGLRNDIKYAFNHCAERTESSMRGNSYAEHISALAAELGLEPGSACGISTGAYSENAAIVTNSFRDIELTAIVTAGIDVNGSRAGDRAVLHESDEGYIHVPGTINIMLVFNCDLTEGALVRALITCTEAKTAAIAELAAPSCYSSGLATGSGTDGAILICNPSSAIKLTEAGTHFKLGELIGSTVIEAVKKALELETGLNAARQFNFFRRLSRYGITVEKLIEQYTSRNPENINHELIRDNIFSFTDKREIVIFAIYIANILDQLSYRLITESDAISAVDQLLKSYFPRRYYKTILSDSSNDPDLAERIISTVNEIIISSI